MGIVDPPSDIHVNYGVVVFISLPCSFPIFRVTRIWVFNVIMRARYVSRSLQIWWVLLDVLPGITREKDHFLISAPHDLPVRKSTRYTLIVVAMALSPLLLIALPEFVGRFQITIDLLSSPTTEPALLQSSIV